MDFGKELPCKYIAHSFEWADSLEVKVAGQLKGWIGLDSLELEHSTLHVALAACDGYTHY